MGKIIDKSAFLLLLAVGLYLLFLNAFGNIAVACVLAFLCCIPAIRKITGRNSRFRMTAADARRLLEQWAYASDDDAREIISGLLGNPPDLVYLPRHPSAVLSLNDVFSAWKTHRGLETLIIASPCSADVRARMFARTLSNPSVEIADAARLIPAIRRSDLKPPQTGRLRHMLVRLRAAVAELPYRRSWKKNTLFGTLLLPVYLLTGNPAYLFLAVGALFLAGVSLRLSSH